MQNQILMQPANMTSVQNNKPNPTRLYLEQETYILAELRLQDAKYH